MSFYQNKVDTLYGRHRSIYFCLVHEITEAFFQKLLTMLKSQLISGRGEVGEHQQA
jgi:hypothetical protein